MAKVMTFRMPQAHIVARGQWDRLFYVIAASAMVLLTAVGFREFLLHGKAFGGRDMTSPIMPLIVAHGLAMLSWIIFFLVQSILILVGNRRLHTVIGPIGGVLAVIIVILASTVATLSVHYYPEGYKLLGGARFFLVEMLTDAVLFGSFVGIGLKYRHRLEIHRPMMLLATLSLIGAATDRCPYIGDIGLIPPLYTYTSILIFGGLLFVLHWGMTRAANRWYAIGYAGMALVFVGAVAIGHTPLWNQMVGTFVP